MAKRQDRYAKMSLDYPDHPKIAGLDDAGFRAHVEMILYSARFQTDGAISKQIATRWLGRGLEQLLDNDSESPSLVKLEDGSYMLHGYDEMQQTRAEIERKRRVYAENGQRGGKERAKQFATQLPSKAGSKNQAEEEVEVEEEVGSARKRATQLPKSWTPTTDHNARASEAGLDINREEVKFRSHAEEKGRTAKSWNAAFTRWLINAAEYAQRDGRPSGQQTSSLWDRVPSAGQS